MCKLLGISRANVYRYKEPHTKSDSHTQRIVRIFNANKNAHETRRIKAQCAREGVLISRRRIGRIMKQEGLVSTYTVAYYKSQKQRSNQALIENIVNCECKDRKKSEVIVRDLTYVKVGKKGNYICTLLDLYNRESIGYSVGMHKDTKLVEKAFASSKRKLEDIVIFHTDCGKEFDYQKIDILLEVFKIDRSLSRAGTPYDNAVEEATYKSIKTEFIYPNKFQTIEELEVKFETYVYWDNTKRLHSTLGYQPPIEYSQVSL